MIARKRTDQELFRESLAARLRYRRRLLKGRLCVECGVYPSVSPAPWCARCEVALAQQGRTHNDNA